MSVADFMGGDEPTVLMSRPGTTDWMDKTTPEDRYKLVAMCSEGHWHHFTGSRDRFSQTDGEACSECGTTRFIGVSLISERAWKPDWKPPKGAKRKR